MTSGHQLTRAKEESLALPSPSGLPASLLPPLPSQPRASYPCPKLSPLRLWLPNNLNWSLLPQQVSVHFDKACYPIATKWITTSEAAACIRK
jgi:hypothetical protein